MADHVTMCECFARDGLQNEAVFVPTVTKLALLDSFVEAGFTRIEATSYSKPAIVPAFCDSRAVMSGVRRHEGVSYKATCPNPRAVERAVLDWEDGYGADELSLLVSATESHSERNLGTSRQKQWGKVDEMARIADGRFRLVGVISVAFGCPFEGSVDPGRVIDDIARFVHAGVDIVTLGDTTGLATPKSTRTTFRRLAVERADVPVAAHFHNTRGAGLANCIAALEAGCRYFDSAFGGVGGHPVEIEYGRGLTGNVCTEDLVSLLEVMGVETNLDLDMVMVSSRLCEEALGRQLGSMVARAGHRPVTKVLSNHV